MPGLANDRSAIAHQRRLIKRCLYAGNNVCLCLLRLSLWSAKAFNLYRHVYRMPCKCFQSFCQAAWFERVTIYVLPVNCFPLQVQHFHKKPSSYLNSATSWA